MSNIALDFFPPYLYSTVPCLLKPKDSELRPNDPQSEPWTLMILDNKRNFMHLHGSWKIYLTHDLMLLICSNALELRRRAYSFNYESVSLAIGLGDESVHFPKDERPIFFWVSELMSMCYVLGICHLSGYISAYYSTKTGNRVQTTSWLQVCRVTKSEFRMWSYI